MHAPGKRGGQRIRVARNKNNATRLRKMFGPKLFSGRGSPPTDLVEQWHCQRKGSKKPAPITNLGPGFEGARSRPPHR